MFQKPRGIKGILFDFDRTLTNPGALDFPAIKKLSTSEIMVVGDFPFDVMAAKAAGAYAVVLDSRGESVVAPGDPEADYRISSLGHILTRI